MTLATAKYSKATTYRSIVKAEIYVKGSDTPVLSTETGEITIKGDRVYLEDSSSLDVGKYVLKVYPIAEDGTGKPATLKVTVKKPKK